MIRWFSLVLGLTLALVTTHPVAAPAHPGFFAALSLLYALAALLAPGRFPLSAAVFLALVASPDAGRGVWLLAALAGAVIRLVRKQAPTDVMPELWAGAALGLGRLYPPGQPWLIALAYLLSWRLNAPAERTAASVGLLCVIGAVASSVPQLPAAVLLVGSLLLAVPVQAHQQTALSNELESQQWIHEQARAAQIAAFDERAAQLQLQETEVQVQLRCLKVVADVFSESARVQNAAHLRATLLQSVRNLIPCDWLGLYLPDGQLLASLGEKELQPTRAPSAPDKARPNLSQVNEIHQVVVEDRYLLALRGRLPFQEGQLELLRRLTPHLPVCLDAIRYQEAQVRALGGEQTLRQELNRLATRLTATLDLLARLVGCRSVEELALTAQQSLPELIPQYQAEVSWRERSFQQGMQLARSNHEQSWPLTSGRQELGRLRLTTTVGQPLSDLDKELLRLFSSQFSCLIETAELHDDLRQTLELLKLSQAQLVQTSKLAAVGQLAAGVAHELNTPLGAVSISCELAQKALAQDPAKAAERIDNAMESVHRMQAIISKLLLYSSYTGSDRRPVDLSTVVEDTLLLIKHGEAKIELRPTRARKVWANPAEIQQVVRSLLVNAVEAGARNIDIALENTGTTVALKVRDDGRGMDEATSNRVYEPFFTTKRVGQGTGLGLSTSLQLVQQHRGSLTHVTRPQQGSVFTLTLPIAPD